MHSENQDLSQRLLRFDKSTRWFHWCFVIPFLLLAASGVLLLCREKFQLQVDQIERVIVFHKFAAIALLTLPTLILLSGNTRAVLTDLKIPFHWTRDDLEWLRLQPLAVLGKANLPPAEKLNAGQKINALLSIFFTLEFTVTGIFLWQNPAALAPCFLHIALFFAWLPVFAGHFYLAALNPSTRHALYGMTLGYVMRDWAEHHHSAWVQNLECNKRPHDDA